MNIEILNWIQMFQLRKPNIWAAEAKVLKFLAIICLFLSGTNVYSSAADPCQDLHKYYCESNPNREVDLSLNQGYSIYVKLLSEERIKDNLSAKFAALIQASGDPLLSTDEGKSLESITHLFQTNGPEALAEHITHFFVNGIFLPRHSLAYDVYYSLERILDKQKAKNSSLRELLSDLGKRPGGMTNVPNVSEEVIGLIQKSLNLLTPNEFLQLTRDIVSNIFTAHMTSPIVRKKSFELALVEAVKTRVITQDKIKAVESEYAEVVAGANKLIPELATNPGIEPPRLSIPRLGCPIEERSCAMEVIGSLLRRQAVFRDAIYDSSISIGLGFIDEPKDRIFSVLAHEYGHFLVRKNLLPNNGSLRTCLSDPQGASVKSHQVDESAADLFAAEMLAWRLGSKKHVLNPSQKRQLVADGAVYFCADHREDNHLLPKARTNRLFMAHPELRSAFECPVNETSKPKYCSVLQKQ